MAAANQAVRMSNEIEDFQGGALYPGGTGLVKKCEYRLHDYNGKQPKDSFVALFIDFQPVDGSNEGKEASIFWNLGPANEFVPDMASNGGHVIALHGRAGISDNSNVAMFLTKLKQNCATPAGKLSGETGVHAMEGTELTLAQVDQPKREGLTDQREGRKMLIPTRAKWSWEMGTAATATRTAAATTSHAASTPAVAATNGDLDAGSLVKEILTDSGGFVDIADLPKLMLGKLTNVKDRKVRMALAGAVKEEADVAALATARGWKLDNGVLFAT